MPSSGLLPPAARTLRKPTNEVTSCGIPSTKLALRWWLVHRFFSEAFSKARSGDRCLVAFGDEPIIRLPRQMPRDRIATHGDIRVPCRVRGCGCGGFYPDDGRCKEGTALARNVSRKLTVKANTSARLEALAARTATSLSTPQAQYDPTQDDP
ncbi:hypothetical protein, partial [Rhizobium acidisoli]|uniref:hypothetical protein n=1 Tax=Rhizobium acidisoli TaxID=1538158 RepID=UPI001AEC20AC